MPRSPIQSLEALEPRRLFSLIVPAADAVAGGDALTVTPVIKPSGSNVVLTGTKVNAEAGQQFRAVLGTITDLSAVPAAMPANFALRGQINWGDGTAASAATFQRQANGTIDVVGQHTYANPGTDDISVLVFAAPSPPITSPTPTAAAFVRLIGTFHSKANVLASPGGVTLEETAGVNFTATVGFFSSNLSSLTMTAVIDWGDGTQSLGKILALPTAGLVGRFAVSGTHTYSATGSYIAHVTVISSPPPPVVDPTADDSSSDTTDPTTNPPAILVAQIDSVVEVLPPASIATTGVMVMRT